MQNTKLLTISLLALGLAGAASSASAQDRGFYAGGGVGQTSIDEQAYDDEDTAYSVFGGYQFNRHLAVEGGYTDFGNLEPSNSGAPLEADTVYVAAVASVSLSDNFSLYGRAGFHSWNLDTGIPGLTGTSDDNDSDPLYGLGAQYRFNEQLALRAEVTRFEIRDADVDVAQLQVRFDF